MAYLELFYVFFKVGLFTIGGGLVAIPILQQYVQSYQWVSDELFVNMIAVSQSTPGPIGINMATFVGFNQFGFLGSVIATIGMVSPSIIIIYFVSKFLKVYQNNVYVKGVLSGVRPVVIGLILGAAYYIGRVSFLVPGWNEAGIKLIDAFDMHKILFFILILVSILKFKKHPLFYLSIGAFVGILLF